MAGLVSVLFIYRSYVTLAALLLYCTVVEQRAVILFLSEDVKTYEILTSHTPSRSLYLTPLDYHI